MDSVTMPKDGPAPRAFRNKKHGYRLWKEGYVRAVSVKPNVKGGSLLFLVKSKVHASMKNVQYNVYVHLEQANGNVVYAKCNCKAGQGGFCKHVAALLYTILDYVNMDMKGIPRDLTCTQVGQKWHVPSGANRTEDNAFKFSSLVFEKSEEGKKRKRPLVQGNMDFCATPPFARETTSNELQSLTEKLRLAGKASLFCEALESNEFQPCKLFETSSSKAAVTAVAEKQGIEESNSFPHLLSLYNTHLPSDQDDMKLLIADDEILENVTNKVDISGESSFNVCCATIKQNTESAWYIERSKRITASDFGKVLNRRKNISPTSIVNSITSRANYSNKSMPSSLKWGIEHEDVAIEEYEHSLQDLSVKKCGFVASPQWPWLGCSPDGIVMKDDTPVGCVEVKCPSSKKDMTFQEACNDTKFFLRNEDGGCKLKKHQMYYYQCQGVLNILGLDWIDFVVFTNKELHVERIYKDDNLWRSKMLPELTSFYVTYILPKL
eukprot:gene21058-23113_t